MDWTSSRHGCVFSIQRLNKHVTKYLVSIKNNPWRAKLIGFLRFEIWEPTHSPSYSPFRFYIPFRWKASVSLQVCRMRGHAFTLKPRIPRHYYRVSLNIGSASSVWEPHTLPTPVSYGIWMTCEVIFQELVGTDSHKARDNLPKSSGMLPSVSGGQKPRCTQTLRDTPAHRYTCIFELLYGKTDASIYTRIARWG